MPLSPHYGVGKKNAFVTTLWVGEKDTFALTLWGGKEGNAQRRCKRKVGWKRRKLDNTDDKTKIGWGQEATWQRRCKTKPGGREGRKRDNTDNKPWSGGREGRKRDNTDNKP